MQYDTEHCWNSETDKMDKRKLKVKCPSCDREYAALCSAKTRHIKSGMQWVGCDYKEGFSDYETECKCGHKFMFSTVCS